MVSLWLIYDYFIDKSKGEKLTTNTVYEERYCMVYRNDKYLAATPKVFRWDFLYFLKDANIVKLLTRKHLSALQKQKNV